MAVVIADDDRRWVHANAAACALLGVDHDDLIGMRVEEITGTPPDEVEAVWSRFARGGRGGRHLPPRSPVGARQIPYISVADVTPGRHLAILIPARGDGSWQPLSQREREVVALVVGRRHRPRGRQGAVGDHRDRRDAHPQRDAPPRRSQRSHLVTLAILRHEIEVDDVGASR